MVWLRSRRGVGYRNAIRMEASLAIAVVQDGLYTRAEESQAGAASA